MSNKYGNKTKLPKKEAAAAKVVGRGITTARAGFVVFYKGEKINMYILEHGGFKKTLHKVVKMQERDPDFGWEYYDSIPDPT